MIVAFLDSSGLVRTESDYLLCFQSESAVFIFLLHSVDGS